MNQLKNLVGKQGIALSKIMVENERAISGIEEAEIYRRIENILKAMEEAVEQGLRMTGPLPGHLGVQRKASRIYQASRNTKQRFMMHLNSYALAVAEENAAGHRIVTAPTAGSSGVLAAMAYAMKRDLGLPPPAIRKGVLAAGAVGLIAKNNASIAGAEVGCQGEIGVAAAMTAAMLAYAQGYSLQVMENAAETALEHHLGLTCDPVGGYVQIPCIDRNAMGVIKAFNAFLIAAHEKPSFHRVTLDKVIRAMAETGRDMSKKYKETSKGGLAVAMVDC